MGNPPIDQWAGCPRRVAPRPRPWPHCALLAHATAHAAVHAVAHAVAHDSRAINGRAAQGMWVPRPRQPGGLPMVYGRACSYRARAAVRAHACVCSYVTVCVQRPVSVPVTLQGCALCTLCAVLCNSSADRPPLIHPRTRRYHVHCRARTSCPVAARTVRLPNMEAFSLSLVRWL